jgi:hypothetical protein
MKNLIRHTRTVAFMAVLGVLSAHGMDNDIKPAPAESGQLPAINSDSLTGQLKTSPRGLHTLLNMLQISQLRKQRTYPFLSQHSSTTQKVYNAIHKTPHTSWQTKDNDDEINLSTTDKKLAKKGLSAFSIAAWTDLQPLVMETISKYGTTIFKWFR